MKWDIQDMGKKFSKFTFFLSLPQSSEASNSVTEYNSSRN